MLTHQIAKKVSASWIAAWNAHDLDAILAHYTEDFEMSSPRIPVIAGEASGTLKGKAVIGAYWKKAFELSSNLHFEHISTFVSTNSLIIHYKGLRGLSAEVLFLNDAGKVYKAAAHYL